MCRGKEERKTLKTAEFLFTHYNEFLMSQKHATSQAHHKAGTEREHATGVN